MENLKLDTLRQIKSEALAALSEATDAALLEQWRITYIGRKGLLPQLLRQVKDLSKEDKQKVGRLGNAIRKELEQAYSEHRAGTVVAAPLRRHPQTSAPGHLHPLTQALNRSQAIFADMGFQFVEGPEVERAEYNFDYLNINSEHPARAETDTFYIKDFPSLVLRTHVSTMQSRGVLDNQLKPPIKLFYYGPTYRSEKEDPTHGAVFQQYEFMVVDEQVTLSNLKYIVQTFYSQFFGREMEIRFRPGYFPFVEPGLEVDMRDKVTKKGKWLEMAGAGAMHPHVLDSIGLDPEKYQGIALGGGLDRLAMLYYGIPDIRLFYEGNIRFLKQF